VNDVGWQARATKQQHEISRLESEVSRLEDVRIQQETSIQHLHDTVGKTSEEHGRKQDQAAHTVHALTSELRTTKQALEDVTKRERQVFGSFNCYSVDLSQYYSYYYYYCFCPVFFGETSQLLLLRTLSICSISAYCNRRVLFLLPVC